MARRNRFVSPDTVRLELSDGDWIEVKRELTNAEWEQLAVSGFGSEVKPGGNVSIDWSKFKLARMEAWLTDWSFRDDTDKPVMLTGIAIASLNRATAQEIDAALDRHVSDLEAQGNVPSGVIELAPSSKS